MWLWAVGIKKLWWDVPIWQFFVPSIEIPLQYHRNFFQRITFISCIFFSFQGETSYGSQFVWVIHSAINSSSCPWVFRYTAVKERTNILGLSCYCLYSSRHTKIELTAISLFHVYTLHYDQVWKVLSKSAGISETFWWCFLFYPDNMKFSLSLVYI